MWDCNWETLLQWRDEQWDMYSDEEYIEWCDSQPTSLPEPEDLYVNGDPNYDDDF